MNRLLTLLFLLLSPLCFAQSFDCGKAPTDVEKMICSSEELKALDSELGVAYKAALKDAGEKAPIVQDNQRWWLTVRDNCTKVNCLARKYIDRLDWFSKGYYEWNITPWPEDQIERINELATFRLKHPSDTCNDSDFFAFKASILPHL